MPELPEVETVKKGLKRFVVGKTITTVSSNWPKSFPNATSQSQRFVHGAKIIDVKRRAKLLIIDLDSKYSLVIHLKMTGQMVYRGLHKFGAGHPSNSLVGDLPDKTTRVIFTFSDGSNLYFNDMRKFGWVKLLPTEEVKNMPFIQKLGPEPLSTIFTQKLFISNLMKRPNTNIKAALLDQTVLAGIGNIYADESLWAAKIHPKALVKNLTKLQIYELYKGIGSVLREAIEKGGSTDRNYVNAEGQKGSYMNFARVFRRDGLACPRCDNIILKMRVAGRGTHYCPKCQSIDKYNR
jgi:formamidopyrimidine-DNA glycosylase